MKTKTKAKTKTKTKTIFGSKEARIKALQTQKELRDKYPHIIGSSLEEMETIISMNKSTNTATISTSNNSFYRLMIRKGYTATHMSMNKNNINPSEVFYEIPIKAISIRSKKSIK